MTGLPHAVFLQRVADEPATSPEVRLGQGAFLALRFVDLLAADREPPTPDVFRYQWAATERYCVELSGEGTEAAHLSGIVNATGEAHRLGEVRHIAPALLAYALYLEQDASLVEAEDVLETLIRVGGERLASADAVVGWLRLGRVRRMQTNFDRANAAYAEAGRLAASAGDRQSLLLSRIGRCNVMYFRGNLGEAEGTWRDVLRDAAAAGCRDAHAQAEHGLGTVLHRCGRTHEGVPHLWRAYELYEDAIAQLRALGDLGLAMLSLGEVDAAERALNEVVRRGGPTELMANTMIELLHCSSYRRDRMSFERWRERVLARLEESPPNIRADYHLKVGIGLARFGNHRRAEGELAQALEIATAHELHELAFRIERTRDGLQDCGALDQHENPVPEPVGWPEAFKEVSASLAALGS